MIRHIHPLVFMVFSVFMAQTQQPVLFSPQWLNEQQKDPDLVILYTGFVIKADFEKEYIAGSRFLWPDWLAFNTPEANMYPPDLKATTKVLQDLGINCDSKIVICHKGADVTIA
jgi:3-mercaptopyruvate sulfurtransferase SseA